MARAFAEIAFTPAVRAAQQRHAIRTAYGALQESKRILVRPVTNGRQVIGALSKRLLPQRGVFCLHVPKID